jgi:hypothetical protein
MHKNFKTHPGRLKVNKDVENLCSKRSPGSNVDVKPRRRIMFIMLRVLSNGQSKSKRCSIYMDAMKCHVTLPQVCILRTNVAGVPLCHPILCDVAVLMCCV